jgi:O-antigen ligase
MLFVSIIFLLMTKSKTSMAMTVLALVVMGAPPFIAKGGPRLAMGVFCLFICGAAGTLLVLAIHEFDLVSVISLVIEDMSFTGRDELWGFAWKAASERLWAGHGYGAFWDVGLAGDPLARLDPGTWLGDVEPGIINQAHNGYLELLLQLGLPVTILATIVIFGLLIKGIYYWATMKGKPGTRAGIAFLTVMPLVFLLHNLTEASLFLRGIILCNVLFVILFLLVRLHELEGGRPNTSPDQIPARFL